MDAVEAWRVLGLPCGSTAAEVRRAFRRAAQILHPDRVAELGADVVAEAQRRMVELGEAYRVCNAVSRGAPPPPPRAARGAAPSQGPLKPVGGQAAALLAEARRRLSNVAPWAAHREVVMLLEQVADAWPGTAEGDAARVLLVSSAAARNATSPRERAGHLVLIVDPTALDAAWDELSGRDELSIAQVVYAHPTVTEKLRHRARTRLAELDDWRTLADDEDVDFRLVARAHVLLQEARLLAERTQWLTRRERPAYDADLTAWRLGSTALIDGGLDPSLTTRLRDAEAQLVTAGPSRAVR